MRIRNLETQLKQKDKEHESAVAAHANKERVKAYKRNQRLDASNKKREAAERQITVFKKTLADLEKKFKALENAKGLGDGIIAEQKKELRQLNTTIRDFRMKAERERERTKAEAERKAKEEEAKNAKAEA